MRDMPLTMCSLVVVAALHFATLIVPVEDVAKDHVDLIELNHFYDDEGRKVFDQLIFYDWCNCAKRYQVRAHRLVKCSNQLPERDWEHGWYVSIWMDKTDGEVMRLVRADLMRETWTQYDPELCEREVFPEERRVKLRSANP